MYKNLWNHDPSVIYLNHGSFGSCPGYVMERQAEYRLMMEREPVRFLVKTLEPLLERVRESLSEFVGADPADLVFVQNATAGVNTVLRSLRLEPGDEILCTNHTYGACRQAVDYICWLTGARVVEAVYPFPLAGSEVIIEAVMSKIGPRTRVALIDHITSATALVQPVDELVRMLDEKGIDTLVDGAHAPGSIPLDLDRTGAAWYTANCHKWICAPKGAAFLHARRDKQEGLVPLVVSHAGFCAKPFTGRFYWPGTWDPSPVLAIDDALRFMEGLMKGGWPEVMSRNRTLCLETRKKICEKLGIDIPCPDSMIASMATFPLPPAKIERQISYKDFDPLQEMLFENYGIEIPVWNWGNPASQLTRISVQLYNHPEEYDLLGQALSDLIKS